jgi:hypothetical protein
MAMNFPNAPTTGQLYPSPAVAGLPVYRWDGSEWTTQGVQPNRMPVYTDGSQAMAAQLTLVGDPVNPTDAADKHYIDGRFSGLTHVLAIRVFDASGTYVPTAGMVKCIAEAVGGGSGGCGQTGNAAYLMVAAGGGSGAYARRLLTAAQIGASQPIVIGVGGNGGPGGAVGAPGGDTTFGGSLLVAKGAPAPPSTLVGASGGPLAGCVGDVTQAGNPGFNGGQVPTGSTVFFGGQGANSVLGGGAIAQAMVGTTATGNNAFGPGGGGGGGAIGQAGGVAGGLGGAGRIIITEFG